MALWIQSTKHLQSRLQKKKKRMMSTEDYDIVLIPSPELCRHAIEVSQLVKDSGALFTLEMGKVYPHLSVYMARLLPAAVKEVKEFLAALSGQHKALELKAEKYFSGGRYLDVQYSGTDEFNSLQERIIHECNKLRSGIPKISENFLQKAEGKARENIEQFGYKNVFELSRPHITFTRFAEVLPDIFTKLPDVNDFSGSFVGMGLYEINEIGTCIKEIAVYSFRS